jgi:hypothetical protein
VKRPTGSSAPATCVRSGKPALVHNDNKRQTIPWCVQNSPPQAGQKTQEKCTVRHRAARRLGSVRARYQAASSICRRARPSVRPDNDLSVCHLRAAVGPRTSLSEVFVCARASNDEKVHVLRRHQRPRSTVATFTGSRTFVQLGENMYAGTTAIGAGLEVEQHPRCRVRPSGGRQEPGLSLPLGTDNVALPSQHQLRQGHEAGEHQQPRQGRPEHSVR